MTAAGKKSPKRSAGRSAGGATLRFHHSEESEARMLAVLAVLEESDNPEEHREALAELVADLTEAGMDYYYLRALKLSNAGPLAQQSARLGIAGAVKMISSVSRRFIMRMNGQELLAVAGHIRSLAG
jgi:hypothetical protein